MAPVAVLAVHAATCKDILWMKTLCIFDHIQRVRVQGGIDLIAKLLLLSPRHGLFSSVVPQLSYMVTLVAKALV